MAPYRLSEDQSRLLITEFEQVLTSPRASRPTEGAGRQAVILLVNERGPYGEASGDGLYKILTRADEAVGPANCRRQLSANPCRSVSKILR